MNKVDVQEYLKTTPLSETERVRTQNDLRFIDFATKVGKELGYRVVIHGGYAVDGNLGKITRPHKDLDVQVYGRDDNPSHAWDSLINRIRELDPTFDVDSIEDKGRQEYYHNFLIRRPEAAGIDLYYLQVAEDPLGEKKIIVKKDGSLSDIQSFGEPNIVSLEGVGFEAASPTTELVDKIYKREHRGDKKEEKHEQDIENLRLITNPEEISRLVTEKIK
jgi:hypothetical protein